MKLNIMKKPLSIIISVLIFVLSVCCYFMNANINVSSTSTGIEYKRYNCATGEVDEYTLTLDAYGAGAATVFDEDDRVPNYDTAVVRVGETGTGFIVDEHVIATAAHCVCGLVSQHFGDFGISIIDLNGNVFFEYEPTYVHIPVNYNSANNDSSLYDYALIYVEEDLTAFGMIPLGLAKDQYISNAGAIKVAGFPGIDSNERLEASGNLLTTSTSSILKHHVDTEGGDSGGPVYVEESISVNGEPEVYKTAIGIHFAGRVEVGGVVYDDYNKAIRITPDILKFYYTNPNLTE